MKKGQEGIIVTVLLILIAIAAIAVVAYFVLHQVNSSVAQADLKSKNFEIGIDKAEIQNGVLNLVLSRGSSTANFTGLKIVMTASGKSQTYDYRGYINPLETISLSITLSSDINSSGTILVEVYPYIITVSGQQQVAPKSYSKPATYTSSSGNNNVNPSNPPIPPTPPVDVLTGLVAYYPLNGNANDYSGNGNTGTPRWELGADTIADYISGKNSTAIIFNQSSTIYLSIPNSNSLSSFSQITVSAWIYSRAVGGGRGPIIMKPVDLNSLTSGGFGLIMPNLNDNRISFFINDLVDSHSATTTINPNQWSYVVGTYNGTKISLYVNGALVSNTNYNGVLINSNYPLCIAGMEYSTPPSVGSPWQGYMDDVRIYNRALTSNDVSALYNSYS